MELRIDIDTSHIIARFEKMLPDVHDALLSALRPLADEAAKSARDAAAEHIRYLGKSPGQYLASIYGGVSDKGTSVLGYVRSPSPLAHLLEYGAKLPSHTAFPSIAQAMAFEGGAGMVFAKAVNFPGANVPAYPAIKPSLLSIASQVEEILTKAVKGAMNATAS